MSDPAAPVSPLKKGTSTDGGTTDNPSRRTIAVLVDWLTDGYQNLVFAGMADAAKHADVNLLCLPGGVLDSPLRSGALRNFIYNFASPGVVDGVLLMAGTLGNHVGPVGLARFCERFATIPVISVAVPVPGLSTVAVQDAEGMRDAIRHLVRTHGYRRIAFIRGPEVNDEAERRFKAYREVLSESGIAFDQALVAPGDFQFESGTEAIRLLLDERQISFDAIVGVNDHMVLGALHELHARGIQVPGQVALVGFDDIDESRFVTPALTTVRQPLYQQGVRALQLILDQVSRRRNATTFHLKTELIIRESCGCSGPRAEPDADAMLLNVAWRDDTWEQRLSSRRSEVCRQMSQQIDGARTELPPEWESQLLDAWCSDLLNEGGASFLPLLRRLVIAASEGGVDASCWQGVISAMRRLLSSLFVGHESRRELAENLWHQAREQVAVLSERGQARQRLRFDQWARTLSETSEALLGTVDTASLVSVLADKLPQCGIPAAYLCLFEDGILKRSSPLESPPQARLVLAYDQKRAPDVSAATAAKSQVFPLWSLLPPGVLAHDQRSTLVVEPLFVKGQELGYLILEVGPREGIIYESLRKQVSSAVHGARLVEHALTEAEGRMQGLKLEGIGTLAAGIAHELNTPIQYVGDSIHFLKDALESYQRVTARYRQLLVDGPTGATAGTSMAAADAIDDAEDLTYLADEAPKACQRSQEGIQRVAGIVNAMKEFARADSRTPMPADINRALANTLEVARGEYRDCADVHTDLGDIPPVRCFIGEVNQVFLNLIINAAHAIQDVMSKSNLRGAITVRTRVDNSDVIIEIQDTGGGIPATIQGKVFDPFFTTKPVGRGSGQGLAISRTAIVGHHGGALTFETREGIGTVFRIRLPVSGKFTDPGNPAVS